MNTWNGIPLYACSTCGWATTDAAAFAEHGRISGHKEPEKAAAKPVLKVEPVEPVLEVEPEEPIVEVEPEKPEVKKKKSRGKE